MGFLYDDERRQDELLALTVVLYRLAIESYPIDSARKARVLQTFDSEIDEYCDMEELRSILVHRRRQYLDVLNSCISGDRIQWGDFAKRVGFKLGQFCMGADEEEQVWVIGGFMSQVEFSTDAAFLIKTAFTKTGSIIKSKKLT